MKYLLGIAGLLIAASVHGQAITGSWQEVNHSTCFQAEVKESQTEKELLPMMGGSGTTVAKVVSFDERGKGKEGIYSKGSKKGSNVSEFQYKVSGTELQFVDAKSGIITQRFVIDELTETTLTWHNVLKDCESRSFTRIK